MEGMGGIEAARTLRQSGVDAVVIFITGIREYVFEAFDVSAFHYLLKPTEEQKFMEVLGRAEEEVGKRKGQKVEVHTTDMEDIIESYATMDELEGQLGVAFTAAAGDIWSTWRT